MKSYTAIPENPSFVERFTIQYQEPLASALSRDGRPSLILLLIFAAMPLINIVWLVMLLSGSEHTVVFLILNAVGALVEIYLSFVLVAALSLLGLLIGLDNPLFKPANRWWITALLYAVIVLLNVIGFFGVVFLPQHIAIGSLILFVFAPFAMVL